jgi:hypothetical protein
VAQFRDGSSGHPLVGSSVAPCWGIAVAVDD